MYHYFQTTTSTKLYLVVILHSLLVWLITSVAVNWLFEQCTSLSFILPWKRYNLARNYKMEQYMQRTAISTQFHPISPRHWFPPFFCNITGFNSLFTFTRSQLIPTSIVCFITYFAHLLPWSFQIRPVTTASQKIIGPISIRSCNQSELISPDFAYMSRRNGIQLFKDPKIFVPRAHLINESCLSPKGSASSLVKITLC